MPESTANGTAVGKRAKSQQQLAIERRIRAHTNPDSSNQRGRRRDARLIERSLKGPVWVEMLVVEGEFPSRQTAMRRLQILEEEGRLQYVGRAWTGSTRKSHCWCNRKFQSRQLQHEVDMMLILSALHPHADGVTGHDADQDFRADIDMTIGATPFHVEMDEETEPGFRVQKRLEILSRSPVAILFVTKSEGRVRRVLTLSKNPRLYVTTLSALLADPWGPVFENPEGKKRRLPKPGAEGAALPVTQPQP